VHFVNLVGGLKAEIVGKTNIDISGIAYDSRQVNPGDLFVAIPGFKTDGHQFINQAVSSGAAALVVTDRNVRADVPVVYVDNSRKALAFLAANFYGHPSHALKVFGVTGTNGKTTTCHLLREVFSQQGYKVGVMGTIGNWLGTQRMNTARTTPESLEIQKMFRDMVDSGVSHVVMEVSSHALELHRVDQVNFRSAVFTNLSQDHLDFHENLEEYLQAKGKLFKGLTGDALAIINMDDMGSFRHLQEVTQVPIITYGRHKDAIFKAENIVLSRDGVTFDISYREQKLPVALHTPGLFSVYNALAAATVALEEGVEPGAVSSALADVLGVSGRFQRVDCGQEFTVIVDYAHTPDSLKNILVTAEEFVSGRLITVFGCGGDRDKAKRPLMGEVAAKNSDLTVVTSDNPRSEEPEDIISDILPGVKAYTENYRVIEDRRQAIHYAVSQAKAGDMVVIAGKGHETYQEIKGQVFPFDDREVVKDVLRGQISC